MADISNKALALVLTASIVASLGGTMISLDRLSGTGPTGYAPSDTGEANITIEGDISIQFVTDQVDFGSGYTNDTGQDATIEQCPFDTNGTDPSSDPDCVGFNSGLSPLLIENIGNQNVNLDLDIDRSNETFLGGENPQLNWFVEEAEAGSCGSGLAPTSFTPVDNSTSTTVCTDFQYVGANDRLSIHLGVSVPQNADTGSKTATITATAS